MFSVVGAVGSWRLPSQGRVIVAEFRAQMLLGREKSKITGKTIMALVLITR